MRRKQLGAEILVSPIRDQMARIERADAEYMRLTSANDRTCPRCGGTAMRDVPHLAQDGWGGPCLPRE